MIFFKTVNVRNFLSYGNVATEWQLNKHLSTLIIGRNGHGKSVLLDAVCFGLFGKPYRSINKPQLINSINGKNCVVELEVDVNGTPYKIVRGMKPNVFEVYANGKMIDQEAAIRDMQLYLEQQVLKLNFKTFCQVVILGSASFTPFMQLPAYQRREVVEDVLDIGIFSKMNAVLKERMAATKEELKVIEVRVESATKETVSQKKIITLLEENKNSRIAELELEKDGLEYQLSVVDESLRGIAAEEAAIDEEAYKEVVEKYTSLTETIYELKKTTTSIEQRLTKIETMDDCPMCMQGVSHDHKKVIRKKFEAELGKLKTDLDKTEPMHEELGSEMDAIDAQQDSIAERKKELTNKRKEIVKSISDVEGRIEKVKADSGDVDAEKEKLKEIANAALVLINRKKALTEEKQLQEISQVLLKDNGIKTAIIKEYLPVLNKLINKYLTAFDFFVNFNLDENFAEVIRSRGRDEFSYASFSEGEKKRIDLAILLAFRQVAAMKNSAKVNLLIFDEIVDSALDLDARAKFNDLLQTMVGSNVFVISHTDTSPDAYMAVIKVEKQGDFSQYSYV